MNTLFTKSFSHTKWVLGFALILISSLAWSQPANDNWASASVISISDGGFGLGTYNGTPVDITNATAQSGEYIMNPIYGKTAWYKFEIPTARVVSVGVNQPTVMMQPNDGGFFVYKETAALPTASSLAAFTPLMNFGGYSQNICLSAGTYYIQTVAKNAASGSLMATITINTTSSAIFENNGDNIDTPIELGLLSGFTDVTSDWSCMSIESSAEYNMQYSNYAEFNKSLWASFSTGDFIDQLNMMFIGIPADQGIEFSIRVYEGTVTAATLNSLEPLAQWVHLDTVLTTSLRCALSANTNYSLQILGKGSYNFPCSFSIIGIGSGANNGVIPNALSMNGSNAFGTIVPSSWNGEMLSRSDYYSCSALISDANNQCGAANSPTNVPVEYGTAYDMATWFSFSTSATGKLRFSTEVISTSVCAGVETTPDIYFHLYRRDPNDNCTNYGPDLLVAEGNFFHTQFSFDCFPAGDYVIQLMGRSTSWDTFNDCSYVIGREVRFLVHLEDIPQSQFLLHDENDIDRINNALPLTHNVQYTSAQSFFACENSVVPSEPMCDNTVDRAMYRELLIGDGDNDLEADSGLLVITNYNVQSGAQKAKSVFYKGDANTSLQSSGDYSWPNQITGLEPMMGCEMYTENMFLSTAKMKYCVTPGTYTLATLADSSEAGMAIQPKFKFSKVNTLHDDWQNPENLGDVISISDIIFSEFDRFGCEDNAIPIGGFNPCPEFTKQIFREFYLSDPSELEITLLNASTTYTDAMRIFAGRISTDGPDNLVLLPGQSPTCLVGGGLANQNFQTAPCTPLPAGWYTIVTFGFGPNYENNFSFHEEHQYDLLSSDLYAINIPHKIRINLESTGLEGPRFNRPHRASNVNNGAPVVYVNNGTPAVPSSLTVYTLETENFSTVNDSIHMSETLNACAGTNRVAYYVFSTIEPCYMQFMQVDIMQLFQLDARTSDSLLFATTAPILGCNNQGNMYAIGYLAPGTYTMVCLVGDESSCGSITPVICMAPLGQSRFEYAKWAYDFGVIPPDNNYRYGKVGDVHPLFPGTPPSTDTFYSSTGSEASDPEDICDVVFSEEVNNTPINVAYFSSDSLDEEGLYRNLWYTFVTRGRGQLDIILRNRNNFDPLMAALYQSDVNGNLPWSEVVSTNQIDSTYAQGLTLLAVNTTDTLCNSSMQMSYSFSLDGCGADTTMRRLYLLVAMKNEVPLNLTFDVRTKWNPQQSGVTPSLFDSFADAGEITSEPIQNNNTYYGPWDEMSCATSTIADGETACTNPLQLRTIWYRFEINEPYFVRVATELTAGIMPTMRVLRATSDLVNNPDSTLSFDSNDGLWVMSGGVPSPLSNSSLNWMGYCLQPGTYYIQYSRCAFSEQAVVRPILHFEYMQGDYCSDAVPITASGTGVFGMSIPIWCHTSGTDFGEDGSQMGCLLGPAGYASTWFKFNYEGNEPIDVLFQPNLSQLIGYGSTSQVRYRLFYGDDCSNMVQGAECSINALINNSISCINAQTGKFLIQVVYPASATGSIGFNYTVSLSANQNCIPFNPNLVDAEFIHSQTCERDSVYFENYSTAGPAMTYMWDFGDGTQASTYHVNHYYEQGGDYTVSLITTNPITGLADTSIQVIHVLEPGYPIDLGEDQILCLNEEMVLNAEVENATYQWNTNAQSPMITVNQSGIYAVTASIGECIYTDSVNVIMADLTFDLGAPISLCKNESIQIGSNVTGEISFAWMNGSTSSSIEVNDIELVWLEISQGNCSFRDSLEITLLDTLAITVPNYIGWCADAGAIDLSNSFLPAGGSYSINYGNLANGAVATDTFNPAFAPANALSYSTIYYDLQNENGCVSHAQKEVEVYPVPSFTYIIPDVCEGALVDVQTDPNMFNESIGIFELELSNGSQFDLTLPTHFTMDEAGQYTYSITLISTSGCGSVAAGAMTVAAAPQMEITIDGTCANDNFTFSGTVLNTLNGQDQYTWSIDGVEVGSGNEYSQVMPTSGEHSVQLLGVNTIGCAALTASNFMVHDLPVLSINAADMCLQEEQLINTTMEVANGSIAGCETIINNSQTFTTASFIFTPSTAGNQVFQVSAWTDQGCSSSIIAETSVFDLPIVSIIGESESLCFGDTISYSAVNNGEVDIQTFTWSLNGEEMANSSDFTFVANEEGSVDLTLSALSTNGCSSPESSLVTIEVLPAIVSDFRFSPDELSFINPQITLWDMTFGVDLFDRVFAVDGVVVSSDSIATYTMDTEGWHELSLYVEDIYGCESSTKKQIFFDGESLVYVPNAFTPSNDGLNEVFIPVISASGIVDYTFTIFNRWGEEVFTTEDPAQGWNGEAVSTGYYAQDEIYTYRLYFAYDGDREFEKVGHLVMLR